MRSDYRDWDYQNQIDDSKAAALRKAAQDVDMAGMEEFSHRLDAIVSTRLREYHAEIEARLVRVFGTLENARRELDASPLTLAHRRERRDVWEFPILAMRLRCVSCGYEELGAQIWTPECLAAAKWQHNHWRCPVCKEKKAADR